MKRRWKQWRDLCGRRLEWMEAVFGQPRTRRTKGVGRSRSHLDCGATKCATCHPEKNDPHLKRRRRRWNNSTNEERPDPKHD
tara:strand:- start:32601 stop:32846 length:246 start_codon:yes stop_codon:yes gene_type:complete